MNGALNLIEQVTGVVRGREILERIPTYPKHLAELTVLLDAEKPEDRVFFIVDETAERRKFYMSIKIIRYDEIDRAID